MELRNKTIKVWMDSLYKTIDEELQKNGFYRQDTANMFGPADIDIKLAHLKNDYESIGWKVTRQEGYDQRDGDGWDYITIT